MSDLERIYSLLLHGKGLSIRAISKELKLDKYYVAEILFSVQNIAYWFQDDDSLWYAKEGTMQIEEHEDDKLTCPLKTPNVFSIDRYIQDHSSSALRTYLQRLSSYRTYSDEDIVELFRMFRNGDEKAYDLIVKSQQKLVLGIAKLYRKHDIPLEDIIQEGNVGLIKAIQRFDYEHFRSFPKYAKGWILQAISNSMTYLPYMIRLPLTQLPNYRKIHRFKEKYEQLNGYEPAIYDIEIDGLDNKKIACLSKLPDRLSEMTIQVDDLDVFESHSNPTIELIEKEHNSYFINELIHCLNEREAFIIKTYFGIGKKQKTLDSIGEYLNITRERARQIAGRSLKKMQEYSGFHVETIKIGEYIQLSSTGSIGRVIDVKKTVLGSTLITLRMNEGPVREIVEEETSFIVLKNNYQQKGTPQYLHNSIVDENGSSMPFFMLSSKQDLQHEETDYNDLEVGDKIYYKKRYCTVNKITGKGKNSKLYIEYANGVMDVVLNNKSRYEKISHDRDLNKSNHKKMR